jgi:hypothetical protein
MPVAGRERDTSLTRLPLAMRLRAIHAEPPARGKLAVYARALRAIHERLTPLMRAERRASNMRRFAAELAATGQLRSDVDVDEAADVIWATNAPEFYLLLVRDRGWSPDAFEAWLIRAWTRLLVSDDEQ